MALVIVLFVIGALVLLCIAMIFTNTVPKVARRTRQLPRKLPGYELIPGGRTGHYTKRYTFEDKLEEDLQREKKLAQQLKRRK